MLGKLKIQEKLSLLKSRSGLRAIIANTGWLFADRILRMGVALFVGVWVARYLGAKQFGVFNYAMAFVALFNPISTLGLNAILIRNIVNDSSNKEQLLGTTFWLKIFGGVISLSLAVGCAFLFRSDSLTIWLVLILATGGFFESFDTIDLLFQSQVQSKYTVVAKNTAFILVTLLQVSLITMQAPLIAFAWAKLTELGLAAIGLMIAYKVKGYSIKLWRWSFSLAKNLLKESWPLILSGLTIMVYMKIDQIMLGKMVGDQAVGIYSAATRISEVWYFIPTAICSSVNPSIYAAKEKSEKLYYHRIGQLLRLMNLLSIIVAVPMTFLSGTIITMLFGNDYGEAGSILSIHVWASLFVFMGVATSSWFVAEGLTHLSFRRTLMGAIINVVLNFFLIPVYGGVGAAITTVISQAFASFVSNGFDLDARKIFQIQLKSFFFLNA
ncbi:MAG: flippase [Rivularia sp. T60_A2020_040]|nr:flippase [Rivularia sp. T60_A2020_040]